MRIAVCDDDQNFCKEMLKCLQDYFKEKKLKQPEYVCFSNGEAMMKAGGVFDMAFLDVEMDGISGIHAGEYLKKKNDKILIFILHPITCYSSAKPSYENISLLYHNDNLLLPDNVRPHAEYSLFLPHATCHHSSVK